MLDLAIDNGTVITMDPDRRVLVGGGVGIQGDRIAVVAENAAQIPDARRRIDATGKYMLPGIVDSHGHAGHSLTRGLGEGKAEGGWMEIVETLYFHASDERFWQAESRLAALERLKFGVTTSVSMTGSSPRIDDPTYALAAATGYRELGLRHIVAAGPPQGPWPRRYTDRTDPAHPRDVSVDLDEALRVTEACVQAFRDLGEERIMFYVGPSAISPSADGPDDFVRAQVTGVKEIVARYTTGLHTHAYQGNVRTAYQIDPEIFGPHACLAHCAGIEPDEIEILARTKTSASSGPLTHAFVLNRFGVIEALEAGVNVVFSTDGSAPDRNFDLIDQARTGMQLQRAYFADDRVLPAGKALGMITIDAARALNLHDRIGSLEPDKQADVILLNARQAHLAPNILAPLRVIGHANGHDVDTVIVDGAVLMAGRQVHGVDEARILDEAEAAFAETYQRAGFTDPNALHPDTWRGVRYRVTDVDRRD